MPLDYGQGSEQTHEQALTAPEAMENSCSLSLCSLGALRGRPLLCSHVLGVPQPQCRLVPHGRLFPLGAGRRCYHH